MSKANENKKGYIHTPLGWIPEEWETVRIEDVAKLNPPRNILPDEEEVSFLGMADVSEEGKIVNFFIRKYGDVKNGFTYFKDGDILVAKITPCFENGKGALAKNLKNGIGFGSTEFHVIRSGEKVFPTYLFYHTRLYRFRGHGEQNMTGSAGQKRVPTDFIETYKIPLPPIAEQRRIAAILSTWDEAITKTQQLISQLQQRNKGLTQQLLTGKKRLNGFEHVEWKKLHANEIFKSVSLKNRPGEQLLSATQDKGIIPRSMLEARVTMPAGETASFKLVEKGDFVISLRSFQGGIEYSEYRGLVSPAYTVLKPAREINNFYYKHYFKSYDFIGHLAVAVIGIRDGKQVSYEDFSFLKLPYPSVQEQKAIAKVLDAAVNEVKLYEQRLAALQQQKKGLMQKLLTGEIRVKVDNNQKG